MAYGHGKSSRQTIIGIGIIVTVALLLLIGSQTPSVETTTVVSDTASPTLPNDRDGTQTVATTSDGVTEIVPKLTTTDDGITQIGTPLSLNGGLFAVGKTGVVAVGAGVDFDKLPAIVWANGDKNNGVKITASGHHTILVKNIGQDSVNVEVWGKFKDKKYGIQSPTDNSYEIPAGSSIEFSIGINDEADVEKIGLFLRY